MKKDINYMNDNELIVQINEIKKDKMNTRNRVLMDANKELLYLYYRIGKMIYENQKYGTDFINTLSTSLKLEFKDASGFSPRNLSRMKKFYLTYKDMSNLPTALAKLPWTHNCILIEKVKEYEKRIWYAKECIDINFLDFIFVGVDNESKGIGQIMWREVEKQYPQTIKWQTYTTYFGKRNIHFYVNKLGFKIIEYYNSYHEDPNEPVQEDDEFFEGEDDMFEFEKLVK